MDPVRFLLFAVPLDGTRDGRIEVVSSTTGQRGTCFSIYLARHALLRQRIMSMPRASGKASGRRRLALCRRHLLIRVKLRRQSPRAMKKPTPSGETRKRLNNCDIVS